ncbi:MAG TPA: hypothetical protein VGJ20_22145 [Xanthobacteraceae bacterium]
MAALPQVVAQASAASAAPITEDTDTVLPTGLSTSAFAARSLPDRGGYIEGEPFAERLNTILTKAVRIEP